MKPAKTVRLRVSAEFDLDSESAEVILAAAPRAVYGFLTTQFRPERLRVERVVPHRHQFKIGACECGEPWRVSKPERVEKKRGKR